MIEPRYESSPGDEPEFDQLVDGELSEARRQELLARLENDAGGWRRCALAFLEAQAWRQATRDAVREPAEPRPAPERLARRWWTGSAGTLLAMAASFGLAFTLGILFRGWAPITGVGPEKRFAGGPASAGPHRNRPRAPSELPEGTSPSRLHTVLVSVDGQAEPIPVPVIEADRVDPNWLQSRPSAISPDLLRAFRQSGHRVEQRRQFVPIELEGGRRLILPVDQVEVRFVGHQ